ncbi:response regulator [Pseudonocardia sp.]|uniref:response regulator transcription factor n=1 Tax=Pseudonocardia sp. TaxID=60912 RepID=UPI003D114FF2
MPPAARPSVVLVDDHRVFADALALALATQPDLRCGGIAHTVAQAGELLGAAADVALVDLDLPDGSGLALVEQYAPHVPMIVLTAHVRVDLARRAAAAGAAGFLGKDASLSEILDAVRAALTGVPVPSREPVAPVHLTARELDVLSRLARGRDASRIAADLGISLHTTRDHIRAVLAKLGAHSQLDAVVRADRLGIVAVGTGL